MSTGILLQNAKDDQGTLQYDRKCSCTRKKNLDNSLEKKHTYIKYVTH